MNQSAITQIWVETASGSWLGNRDDNEDRSYFDGQILALFDGIGGRAFGDAAATIALAEIVRSVTLDKLRRRLDVGRYLNKADRAVRDLGASLGLHVGTTAVVALLEIADDQLVCQLGWAGDTKALLLRGDGVVNLTSVSDPATVAGEPLRNWLGSGDHLPVRRISHSLSSGDTLILVSDGVTDVLDLTTLGGLVRSSPSAHSAVDLVLNAAMSRGGDDNATVVIARFSDTPGTARLSSKVKPSLPHVHEHIEPADPVDPIKELPTVASQRERTEPLRLRD